MRMWVLGPQFKKKTDWKKDTDSENLRVKYFENEVM